MSEAPYRGGHGNVYTPTGYTFPHKFLHEIGAPHICDDGEVWESPAAVAFNAALREEMLRTLERFEEDA